MSTLTMESLGYRQMLLEEVEVVKAQGDEDGLFIDGLGLESEGHFVGAMEDILVHQV